MKNIILISSLLLFFFSCDTEEQLVINKYNINGVVQKGPFIKGASINIIELNTYLTPNNVFHHNKTSDNSGTYKSTSQISEGYIEISTSGKYFNEIEQTITSNPITLKALSYINDNQSLNLNILTTLSYYRIKHLILEDKLTFDEARKKAESEILSIFYSINEKTEIANFEKLDISKSGSNNSILLAISSILQYNNSETELNKLITDIAEDIATDGILNNKVIVSLINKNTTQINPEIITKGLNQYYEELGLNTSIPNFQDIIDHIIEVNATEKPVISLPSGSYSHTEFIEIESPIEGAIIYYTIDGSEPNTTSTKYSGPISINNEGNSKLTLKTFAKKEELTASEIITQNYTVTYPIISEPRFSHIPGTYASDINITITSFTDGATIYYTLDGSDPTDQSTIYNEAIPIKNNGTKLHLKAIAKGKNTGFSTILTSYYSIDYSFDEEKFNHFEKGINTYKTKIVGKWVGTRTSQWDSSPKSVTMIFYENETYIQQNSALRHGRDNEINSYKIYDLNADGSAIGDIKTFNNSNTNMMKFIRFSKNHNILKFEFYYGGGKYGPVELTLTRVE